MRSVTRMATPQSLDGLQSRGGKELAEARAFFEIKDNSQNTFAFAAYKAEDVREALRLMFHRKCAYCETFYAPAMPDDVEHYRPKAAYVQRGKAKKPGYSWLAMVWTNLLPSCADCNRARKQRIVGKERTETAGKANQFPLATGSVRATAEGGEVGELPLLLDPTVDDPEAHLEFLPNGTVRATRVARGASKRGQKTIEVVALMRRDLVDARQVAADLTTVAITHVREAMADINFIASVEGISNGERAARLAELRTRLDRDIADMEAKAAPETPYSAVADILIRAFKAEKGL